MLSLILSLVLAAADPVKPEHLPPPKSKTERVEHEFRWHKMPYGTRHYGLYRGEVQVGLIDDSGVYWVFQNGVWVQAQAPIAAPEVFTVPVPVPAPVYIEPYRGPYSRPYYQPYYWRGYWRR